MKVHNHHLYKSYNFVSNITKVHILLHHNHNYDMFKNIAFVNTMNKREILLITYLHDQKCMHTYAILVCG